MVYVCVRGVIDVVFFVCIVNFGVVYGVGVCVNVGGVVCVVVCCLFLTSGCCLFLTSGCCLLCCDFFLSVMRVVGGVPLWVVCVFRCVYVVCLCLLYTQLLI